LVPFAEEGTHRWGGQSGRQKGGGKRKERKKEGKKREKKHLVGKGRGGRSGLPCREYPDKGKKRGDHVWDYQEVCRKGGLSLRRGEKKPKVHRG